GRDIIAMDQEPMIRKQQVSSSNLEAGSLEQTRNRSPMGRFLVFLPPPVPPRAQNKVPERLSTSSYRLCGSIKKGTSTGQSLGPACYIRCRISDIEDGP